MKSRVYLALIAAVGVAGALFELRPDENGATPAARFTVGDRMQEFEPRASARWKPFFERAGVAYPPQKLVFLGLKAEKKLEIYAQNAGASWKLVRTLPIVRASGKMGPKLREGDYQVPEGFYQIESLNPNSAYHLAIRVGYPSASDLEIAAREGRDTLGGNTLGGNIMIHSGSASIGCLAMGDEAAEDLFVLAEKSGRGNVQIVLCPLDFREKSVPRDPTRPPWLQGRYADLARFVHTLPRDSH